MNKRHTFQIMMSSICLCLLAGCAYQSTVNIPAITPPAPSDLSVGSDQVARWTSPDPQWWRRYESPELNRLFDELTKHNLNLMTARLRIEKAQALHRQQEAINRPTLDARASLGVSQAKDDQSTSQSLSISAAYGIDLWGDHSANTERTRLSIIAQEQEHRTTLLQLQTQLALTYFDALLLGERLANAEQNRQASEDLLRLVRLRFDAGLASGIEVAQQRNTLLDTQAQQVLIERTILTNKRTLATLLGRKQLTVNELNGELRQLVLPSIASLQPAALLKYRPDVHLAETQLYISDAQLYVEQQKRWPHLNLSANVSLQDLLDGPAQWTTSWLSALTMPLFDAGRIRQQIAAAKVDVAIALNLYQITVLNAMQDVIETLSEWQQQQKLYTIRQQEYDNNLQLYELARLRYKAGDTDFLNLLSAQRSWFSARDRLMQVRHQQFVASVNVFRAMGIAPATDCPLIFTKPFTNLKNPLY